MPTFLETLEQINGGNIWWLTFYLWSILLPISLSLIIAKESIINDSPISIMEMVKDSFNKAMIFSAIVIVSSQAVYLTIYW